VTLLAGIESFRAGLQDALESGGDAARTLVVYRENRFCPQTSFLPERYTQEIARSTGVDLGATGQGLPQ
jgi:putative ABC transport system permease protein